eukprot:6742110-Pyramimonas_sp.AAC.4
MSLASGDSPRPSHGALSVHITAPSIHSVANQSESDVMLETGIGMDNKTRRLKYPRVLMGLWGVVCILAVTGTGGPLNMI